MYTAQVKPTTAAQALMQAGATKPTKPNNKTTISLFDSSNDTAVFSGEAIFQQEMSVKGKQFRRLGKRMQEGVRRRI